MNDHVPFYTLSSYTFHQRKHFVLADRTNGRVYATVLRPSVCLFVCRQ